MLRESAFPQRAARPAPVIASGIDEAGLTPGRAHCARRGRRSVAVLMPCALFQPATQQPQTEENAVPLDDPVSVLPFQLGHQSVMRALQMPRHCGLRL
jgi:hypothetical protein